MPAITRIGDKDTGGDLMIEGSPDVFANDGGGASSMSLDDTAMEFYIASNVATRQVSSNDYDASTTDIDDEGAPSDDGERIPMSNKQIYVAAAAKQANVDISTPPTVDQTGVITPTIPAPPAGGYDYVDIDAASSFPGSFQLSPHFTVGMLSTNTLVSNYKVQQQVTNNRVYTEKDIIKNLRDVSYNVLEPLMVMYPNMQINSGFRAKSNGKSQHERGQAIDVSIPGSTTDSNAAWTIAQNIANSTLPYDQFIFEQNRSIWFHVSYDRTKSTQRRMVMSKPRGVDSPIVGLFKMK